MPYQDRCLRESVECTHPHIHGQASGVLAPSPPPPPIEGCAGGGGGGLAERGHAQAVPKPSHRPYEVVRAPFLINLNLYFKPYTPKPPGLNAGSKPKAEHKPSALT